MFSSVVGVFHTDLCVLPQTSPRAIGRHGRKSMCGSRLLLEMIVKSPEMNMLGEFYLAIASKQNVMKGACSKSSNASTARSNIKFERRGSIE